MNSMLVAARREAARLARVEDGLFAIGAREWRQVASRSEYDLVRVGVGFSSEEEKAAFRDRCQSEVAATWAGIRRRQRRLRTVQEACLRRLAVLAATEPGTPGRGIAIRAIGSASW